MIEKTVPVAKTILVVDDEADLRETIGFVLQTEGFEVLMAGSGKEAIEIVKSKPVDLVLSDVRMPEGSGIELLQWVRNSNYLAPPVLLITGFADLSVEDAHDLGAESIIQKPFRSRALLNDIHRALLPLGAAWENQPTDVNGQLKVQLQFADMKMAIEGHAINVGRGGFFIALQDHFPEVNSSVSFVLEFAGSQQSIQGAGIVRWVRSVAKSDLPSGCGIQITYLDESHRSLLVNMIDSFKPKSFIPKMFAPQNL